MGQLLLLLLFFFFEKQTQTLKGDEKKGSNTLCVFPKNLTLLKECIVLCVV